MQNNSPTFGGNYFPMFILSPMFMSKCSGCDKYIFWSVPLSK